MRTPTPTSDGPNPDRPRRYALLGVLTAATVGAVVLGGVQPASAATTRVTASISAAQHIVTAGRSVVLHGSVTGAHRTVVVQQRVHGTRSWHALTSVRTSSSGHIAVTRTALVRTLDFRLRVAGANSTVVSPVTTVTVPTSNTIVSTSDASPTAGDPITLTGRASLGFTGARVQLQRLVGAVWKSISTTTVAADGGYTARSIATAAGDQLYRTVVPAAAGRPAAVSPEEAFTVSAWFRLADISAVASGSGSPLTSAREVVAGTPYLDGIGAVLAEGTTSTLTYALDSRCSAFRSGIGPADRSDAGFYGVFRVHADDYVAVDRTLDKGSTVQVAAQITGADVLRLTSGALTGTGDAAWGDPEVLCTSV